MFLGDCVTEYESCEDKKNRLSQVNRRKNTNWIVWHINNFQAKPSPSLQWELWPEVGRGEVGPGFSFAKHGFEDGNVQKNASKGRGGWYYTFTTSKNVIWLNARLARPMHCNVAVALEKFKSRTGSFYIWKNIVPVMKYLWSKYDFLSGVIWEKPS